MKKNYLKPKITLFYIELGNELTAMSALIGTENDVIQVEDWETESGTTIIDW